MPAAKTITIKPVTGADLVFTYTDKTEISGAQKDAAGLATMKEGRVTVHFTEDAQTKAKTATRIIVQPKTVESRFRSQFVRPGAHKLASVRAWSVGPIASRGFRARSTPSTRDLPSVCSR